MGSIQYTIPQQPSASASSVEIVPSSRPIHWIGCGQKPASTASAVLTSRSGE